MSYLQGDGLPPPWQYQPLGSEEPGLPPRLPSLLDWGEVGGDTCPSGAAPALASISYLLNSRKEQAVLLLVDALH